MREESLFSLTHEQFIADVIGVIVAVPIDGVLQFGRVQTGVATAAVTLDATIAYCKNNHIFCSYRIVRRTIVLSRSFAFSGSVFAILDAIYSYVSLRERNA